ncbi:MAG: peptide chain release factor 2 [bacterium]
MWKEIGIELEKLLKTILEMGDYLEVSKIKKEITNLQNASFKPDFWQDAVTAQAKMQQLSTLKDKIEPYEKIYKEIDELKVLFELGQEENDALTYKEIAKRLPFLKKEVEDLEFKRIFSGEHDKSNAYLSIHPGAGGTESCDWAAMLLRMYLRWAEEKKFITQTLEFLPGEEAGVKSVTIFVEGKYAYGYLKAEKGVHRLVRISPFDANKRRHTSFASVFVMPEVEELEVEINEDDLRIDTFRSSGPGGQHVNVTDSAVRITHLPTGIVVSCQSERSQYKNKANAMSILRSRIYEYYEEEQKKQLSKIGGEKQEIGWGSQIRSYVFQPYTMVKDHRSNLEIGNGQRVMDGWIDPFIEAYLRMNKKG